MIHCKALLTVSVSTNEITSTGKNQLIQYPELTYLAIIASQQDWKIHLHWVNHVWTDRIGIEPIIAVLETAVLPIKLSTYKVMGNRTPTYGVKVRCSTVELLPDKITAFGIEPKPISHSLIILPLKLYSTLENHYERKRSPGNSTPRRELPPGVEPGTCWSVVNRSIRLSYDSILLFLKCDSIRSVMSWHKAFWEQQNSEMADVGIEPTFQGYEPCVVTVPLICNAVWRSRTSKSFPTECLASISNTIMGIRHTDWVNRHSITLCTAKNPVTHTYKKEVPVLPHTGIGGVGFEPT